MRNEECEDLAAVLDGLGMSRERGTGKDLAAEEYVFGLIRLS
jgi:hypothetical protein